MTPVLLRRAAGCLASIMLAFTLGGAAVAGEMVVITTELFYDGTWNEISADVRNAQPVRITCGIRNEGGSASPGTLVLQVNNGASKVAPGVIGRYTIDNPMSDLYGKIGLNTPIRVTAGLAGGTPSVRGVMEVTKWPMTWGRAGRADSWVTIEASGILRRLGQNDAADSALRRSVPVADPAGYWPLEGGGPLSLSGGGRITTPTSGVTFGGQAGPPGSATLPTFGPSAAALSFSDDDFHSSVGTLRNVTVPDELNPTAWWMSFVFRAVEPTTPAGSLAWQPIRVLFADETTISTLLYATRLAGEYATLTGFDVVSRATTGALDPDFNAWADGLWHTVTVEFEQSGSDISTSLYIDGTLYHTLATSGTLSAPVSWQGPKLSNISNPGEDDTDNTGSAFSIGHVTFGDATHGLSAADYDHVAAGYPGETAGRRAERLCDEGAIAFTSTGDLDTTAAMGPQLPAKLVALFDECAIAESAKTLAPVVTEQREAIGLHFRTRASLYNQTAALALDYAAGHVWEPFEPVPDDQQLANDVTAKRVGGGQARSVQESGPNNVNNPADDPEGVGRYPKNVDVNVASDDQLPGIAGWRRQVGTSTDKRYPAMTVDIRGLSTRFDGEALIDDVLALQFGDRVTIDNPPEWLAFNQVDQLLLGRDESISVQRWVL